MELVLLVITGLMTAASLAVGVGVGYLTVRATTAALEKLFEPASASAEAVAATVVPFVSRQKQEARGLREAA
jgi:hypothetical protein